MRYSRLSAAAGAAVLALALGACGSSDSEGDAASDPTASSSAAAEAGSLTMTDPWVKAADSGMTAVFGTLVNDGDEDVTVVSASSDITDMMELHETVENADGTMAMQPKEGGFVVPAGGDHELAPGGDHIMVMDLNRPLKPGEEVTFTLTLSDGSTSEFTATVKNFTGADENYQNGDMGDMDGMDMDEHSDHTHAPDPSESASGDM